MEAKEQRPFIQLCNNFIDAKYIMLGNNIVKLLESINNDTSLREIVKKCINNFDFTTELGIAISANQNKPKDFVMPKENEKIVALCYLILQQIALNQIDYEAFTNKHFVYDGTINDIYQNFGHYFILPFRNAMLNLENTKKIQIDNEVRKEINVDNKVHQDFINKLKVICNDIIKVVESDYKIKEDKEEEIKEYVDALLEALSINNKKIIFSLSKVILDKIEKIKSLKGLYERFLYIWEEI